MSSRPLFRAAPPSTPARCWRRYAWCCAALLLCLPALGAAEDPMKANTPEIEAAYLRNFARYIVWPGSAFHDADAPWRVCVLGRDPFGAALPATLEGRTEQGRAFEVVQVADAAASKHCHIVYLAEPERAARRAALAALDGRPVLTVSDAPGFLADGGMIRFRVGDHVEFDVDLDRTRAASLTIRTKMLEVAAEVLENGVVRKRR